ncbi:membrane protein [Streptomyces phage Bmoc]|uniref:Membrane protein n=1 Tax=Streptomyces phage Bmoc TaxID=2725629 RepID=A0A6M3SY66_9CAUD|nr:membrane protein [Streptomyces phage Bmoc]QJD50943.1 membrane protein [Streptomyces phage Bmoc]
MPEITTAWIALIGTVLGGVGLKFVEHWLSRSKVRDDTAAQLRNELRTEIQGLKQELNNVEADLDKWRGKYYELMDNFIKVKSELETAMRQLQNNNNTGPSAS